MLLAALLALAQLSSPTILPGVQQSAHPARGHPTVLMKSDRAHRELQQALAAALRDGGIATLEWEAVESLSLSEIDHQLLGARLFACTIGPVSMRWPASRQPSGEIRLFPKKIGAKAHLPRLIVTRGQRVSTKSQRAPSDTWFPIPSDDLTPETEHSISEAMVLWILARSGA